MFIVLEVDLGSLFRTILNMQAVKKLIDSGSRCQRPEDPDDMIIGTWLSSLEIPIIHSPLLHQV